MDLALTGRCALVTGASKGIGYAAASALAGAGADVALLSRDAEALATAAKRIAHETDRRAVAVPADLRDVQAVNDAVASFPAPGPFRSTTGA